MLDSHRLRLLKEFAERGTIVAAATALGYTPSAVSQQLAALEREAGVALLDRTARAAELTDAGRRLAAHAERILLRQAQYGESLRSVRAGEVDVALIDDWSGRLAGAEQGALRFSLLLRDPLVLVVPAVIRRPALPARLTCAGCGTSRGWPRRQGNPPGRRWTGCSPGSAAAPRCRGSSRASPRS